MRINKIIIIEKIPWSFIKFCQLVLKGDVWRSVWRICKWILGLNGLKSEARIFYFTAYTLYKPADMTILFIYMWKKVEKDQLTLDEGQQRIVTAFLRSARNGGVGLKGKEKERFNTIQLRLAELGNKFR